MKLSALLNNEELIKTKLELGSPEELVSIVRAIDKYIQDASEEDFAEIGVKATDLKLKILIQLGHIFMERRPSIDHREMRAFNEKIIELVNQNALQVVELKLGSGDYQGANKYDTRTINIERKDDDLFPSLFDKGHIYQQLKAMIDNEDSTASYLFVTKSWNQIKAYLEPNYNRQTPMSRQVLIGFIAELIRMGYPPIFIEDERDFIDVIETLFNKFYENPDEVKMINRAVEISGKDIIKFPGFGIGENIGERLINHFGSIKVIVNATPEQLMEVKGVGKKLANKIYKIVNGDD